VVTARKIEYIKIEKKEYIKTKQAFTMWRFGFKAQFSQVYIRLEC
jgi:hypothetical protein